MADQQTSITPETQAGWRSIVARAWSDEDFKKRLIDDPNAVLTEAGLPVPRGVNFVVVENEAQRVHLVLPVKPGGDVSVSQWSEGDYDAGF